MKRKKRRARKDSTDTIQNTGSRQQVARTQSEIHSKQEKREREDTREPQILAGVDCRGVGFMYVSKEFYFSTTHNTCTCSFSISTPLCCQWTVPNDRSNISWEHCPNFIVSSGFKFHF